MGWDAQENAYWKFGQSELLYREDKIGGKEAAHWELQCSSLEDWEVLAARFKDSSNKDEIEFCSFLSEEILPPMQAKAEAELRRIRRLGRSHINSSNILTTRPRRATRRLYNMEDYQPQLF